MRRDEARRTTLAGILGGALFGVLPAAAQAPLSPIPDLPAAAVEEAPAVVPLPPAPAPGLPGVQTAPAAPAAPDPLNGIVDRELDRSQRCWAPPVVAGTEAEGGIARIRLALNPDGTLVGEPMIMDKPMGPLGTRFAESAARALKACAPYRLPPERYADWRLLELKFDTWNPDAPAPNAPSPRAPAQPAP